MAVAVRQIGVRELNRLLRVGRDRAEKLEPRLAAVLKPILDAAADEAARNFRARATHHLTAGAGGGDENLDRTHDNVRQRRRRRGYGADDIPTDVHYRQAVNLARSCGTCGYYKGGYCEMFNTGVQPAYTCDEWTRPEDMPMSAAAPGLRESSTMVAVFPRPDEAARIAEAGGEDPAVLHVTLAYLGDVTETDARRVASALAPVAAAHPPLSGTVGGAATFGAPAVALPDVPGLAQLAVAVARVVHELPGVDRSLDHGWTPHVTVAYRDGEPRPPDPGVIGTPLHFDDVRVVRGNRTVAAIPLTGSPAAIVAAATDSSVTPPDWTAPAPNEVLDVDSLVSTLRTKTDPVRLAVVETMMTPVMDGLGLSFDVDNPLVGRMLAQSASQITNIAGTTQLNAMRVIRAAYEQGLSIPDTATAIQAGMKEASVARATLIARTELVGVVNGASLAATSLVQDATGSSYLKTWLTAPGAQYPRHELYEGLDGQQTTLDGTFTVGGDQLQFPGDPSGSPEEVCNCRCTLVYDEAGEQVEVTAEDEGGGLAEGGAPSADEQAALDEEAAGLAAEPSGFAEGADVAVDSAPLPPPVPAPLPPVPAPVAAEPVAAVTEPVTAVPDQALIAGPQPTGTLSAADVSAPDAGTRLPAAAAADQRQALEFFNDGLPLAESPDAINNKLAGALDNNDNKVAAKVEIAQALSKRLADNPAWQEYTTTESNAPKLGQMKAGDTFETPEGQWKVVDPNDTSGVVIEPLPGNQWYDAALTPEEQIQAWPPDLQPALTMPGAKTGPQFAPPLGLGMSQSERQVAGLIDNWAGTSSDSDKWALAVQRATQAEFGLPESTLDTVMHSIRTGSTAVEDSAAIFAEHGDALRAFVRAMYDETQAELKEAGFGDSIILYRGQGLGAAQYDALTAPSTTIYEGKEYSVEANKFQEANLDFQPISSFSSSIDVSTTFTGDNSAMIGVRVPISRIMGTARTGFGCLSEQEFVVLASSTGETDVGVLGLGETFTDIARNISGQGPEVYWGRAAIQTSGLDTYEWRVAADFQLDQVVEYQGKQYAVLGPHTDYTAGKTVTQLIAQDGSGIVEVPPSERLRYLPGVQPT